MNRRLISALLTAVLAGTTCLAQAQMNTAADDAAKSERHSRLQAHMAEHATKLKAKLQLDKDQEGAWESYLSAMKPRGDHTRPSRIEFEQLSTPERLARVREQRKWREAEFERRATAVMAFYATLRAEQKMVFDENTGRHFHRARHWRHR